MTNEKHITRYGQEKGQGYTFKGWRLCITRGGERFVRYFSDLKCGIINWVANNPSDGEFALDILMIAKYLERIGDHATNLAEWVIYSVTGTHKEG